MTQIVSSISGIEIYAPSAGNAPTNSSEVSAIASAYQVVSATATQLYAGTSFLTSVNSTPVSASRAGNAANASMANSAYYDGTGRLISALPDSAAVSAIASAYQVVTATGSAAVGYGLGAETAVSSINGSALLPYGFSAISGNSGNWNSTRTAVTANSANWNSVYNTVNNNSASWGGGGGSVVSPSGTIFVNNGNQVEGTNSAVVVEQTSMGVTSTLSPQVNAIGPTGMGVLTYDYPDESGMNLVFMLSVEYHGADVTVVISGRDNNWNMASASGLIVEGDTSANIPLGPIVSQLSASSDYWINLVYGQDLSAVKAPGYAVTGVGELAWNSALTDVSATVALNSSTWSQGFQYGNSGSYNANTIGIGASGAGTKTDAGIYLTSTHGTGFYKVNELTLNRSGYGETVNFNLGSAGSQVRVSASGTRGGYFSAWNDNTEAALVVSGAKPILKLGVESASDTSISSWNDCYDTVSGNSASWGQGGVDSATVSSIASSYAQDVSAAVSGTVDTVSSQSANWGGSALALSAGPGVKLELSGTTLVASTDETVLYSATAYAPGDTQQSYSLIETPMNFETVRVLAYRPLANGAPWFGSIDIQIANLYNYTAANTLMAMPYAFVGTANNIFYEGQYFINNITSTSWEDGSSTQRKTTETAYTTGYYAHIYKIIGINRTAGV